MADDTLHNTPSDVEDYEAELVERHPGLVFDARRQATGNLTGVAEAAAGSDALQKAIARSMAPFDDVAGKSAAAALANFDTKGLVNFDGLVSKETTVRLEQLQAKLGEQFAYPATVRAAERLEASIAPIVDAARLRLDGPRFAESLRPPEVDWEAIELGMDARSKREEGAAAAAVATAEHLAQLVEFTAALADFATDAAVRQEQDGATARRRHRQVLVAAWAAVLTSIAAGAVSLTF